MSGKNKKKGRNDNTTVNDETQNKSELSIDDVAVHVTIDDVAVHVTIDDVAVNVTIDDVGVKNDAPKYERTQVDELEVNSIVEKKIRLHIFAVPHTITGNEYSSCAFTGKIYRFAKMMQSRGFEVYHYGVEGSQTTADKNIDVLTRTEWDALRVESLRMSKPYMTSISASNFLKDKNNFVGTLSNINLPLYKTFNKKLSVLLKNNYRSKETDIVCLPYGQAHEAAIKVGNYVVVESGIGYANSYTENRIFESYAWLNVTREKQKKTHQPFWYVIPNYYDTDEFPLSLEPKKQIGFLGRIGSSKGCHIYAEIAKKFPNINFILCGQGDPKPFLTSPNIVYKGAIQGDQRAEYLGSLAALIAPSTYLEPFCGVTVEAQLCGTPVLTVDYGGVVETIEQWKTGVRCHVLDDYCFAIEKVLDGYFDRNYIRERVVQKYGMFEVAKQYEKVFKTIIQSKDWFLTKSTREIPSNIIYTALKTLQIPDILY